MVSTFLSRRWVTSNTNGRFGRRLVLLALALAFALPTVLSGTANAAPLPIPQHAVGATQCLYDGVGTPILKATVFTEKAYLLPEDERIWTAVRVQVWYRDAWRYIDAPMKQDNYTRNYAWNNPNGWDLKRVYEIYLPGWAVQGKYFRLVGDFGYNPPGTSTFYQATFHEGHPSNAWCRY